jgi:hypothetical protein
VVQILLQFNIAVTKTTGALHWQNIPRHSGACDIADDLQSRGKSNTLEERAADIPGNFTKFHARGEEIFD